MSNYTSFPIKSPVVLGGAAACGYFIAASAFPIPPVLQAGSLFALFLAGHYGFRKTQEAHHQPDRLGSILNKHAIVTVADKNGIITDVNAAFLEATGYTREELIGENVDIYLGQPSGIGADVRETLADGEVWQGETKMLRKTDNPLLTQATIMPLFDENGGWTGSISARTDISKNQQSIARSQLARAMDLLQEDVWIIDAETQKFRYMNAAACARFNWTKKCYLTKSVTDIGDDEVARQVSAGIADLPTISELVQSFDIALSDKTLQVTVSKLSEFDGDSNHVIILRDITAYVDQERNNAQFVSTVSHELRSPLTSIKGAMGLLLANPTDHLSDKAKGLVEIAHRNAERLVLITNDILDLEKIAAGNMTFTRDTADMTALVQEAVQATTSLAKSSGVSLSLDLDAEPLWLCTDGHRVLQVMNNLLTNAIKFSPSGAEVKVSVLATDDDVTVTVTDQGQGIAEDDYSKIFQRFADFKNSDRASKGGTGLGLSICKLIIGNLDGTIGFDSKIGTGSSFFFVLPRKDIDRSVDEDLLSPRLVG